MFMRALAVAFMLCVAGTAGHASAIWSSNTVVHPGYGSTAVALHSGEAQGIAWGAVSPTGEFYVDLGSDGDLYLWRYSSGAWAIIWNAGVPNVGVDQVLMGSYGDLSLNGQGKANPLWHTNTAGNGHSGAFLVIQDDGNLVLYTSDECGSKQHQSGGC